MSGEMVADLLALGAFAWALLGAAGVAKALAGLLLGLLNREDREEMRR